MVTPSSAGSEPEASGFAAPSRGVAAAPAVPLAAAAMLRRERAKPELSRPREGRRERCSLKTRLARNTIFAESLGDRGSAARACPTAGARQQLALRAAKQSMDELVALLSSPPFARGGLSQFQRRVRERAGAVEALRSLAAGPGAGLLLRAIRGSSSSLPLQAWVGLVSPAGSTGIGEASVAAGRWRLAQACSARHQQRKQPLQGPGTV